MCVMDLFLLWESERSDPLGKFSLTISLGAVVYILTKIKKRDTLSNRTPSSNQSIYFITVTMKTFSLLLLLVAATSTQTRAFVSTPLAMSTTTHRPNRQQLAVAADTLEETFYQAVKRAEKNSGSTVDIDECDRLATQLEQAQGATFEQEGGALSDKEIQDRLDVAEILRLQIELQLRYVWVWLCVRGCTRLYCNDTVSSLTNTL